MPIFIYLYSYIYTSIFRSINFILNQQQIMEPLTKISSLNSNKEENLTRLMIFFLTLSKKKLQRVGKLTTDTESKI